MKPANIIIAQSGQVKLCDLGLAREVGGDSASTSEGRAMGTPDYISPEQARGQGDVDIRSDLYSLGATYYHAVSGKPPFEGPTPAVIMAKHLTESYKPVNQVVADLPSGIAPTIHRLLEKERDKRFQTPTELIEQLEAILEGRYKAEPLIKPRRRRARRRFR